MLKTYREVQERLSFKATTASKPKTQWRTEKSLPIREVTDAAALWCIPSRGKQLLFFFCLFVCLLFFAQLLLRIKYPSIDLSEHHLSATGMWDQLRQCRIEAESADSDAGASRSHTPVHSNVRLITNSGFPRTVTPRYLLQSRTEPASPAVCAHQCLSEKRGKNSNISHSGLQETPAHLTTLTEIVYLKNKIKYRKTWGERVYARFISCWKTPLSLTVPRANPLRQLHPPHLSYSPALLHGDISKAVLRNGKTHLVLPRTKRLSVIWSFQNTETLLVAPRRALCALSCFFQKHSWFFYSENYAAACNRRDPIRLRSITFFNRFPCCFYDGRQFCPIGDVGGVPKARILRQWWMAKGGSSVSVFSPLQGGVPPWGRVFSRRICLQIARDG